MTKIYLTKCFLFNEFFNRYLKILIQAFLFVTLIFGAEIINAQSLNMTNNIKTKKMINQSKQKLDNKALFMVTGDTTENKKEINNSIGLNGVGEFTFSSATIIPDLKILADLTYDSVKTKGIYGAVNLYGLQKINENNIQDNAVNLLIKEPSFWGLGLQGATYLVNQNDKKNNFLLGLNLNLDYTSRKISTTLKDSVPGKYIEPSSYILKVGVEGILFKAISGYLNFNKTEVVSGIDNFKSYFNTSKTSLQFWDFGFRCVLNSKTGLITNSASKVFIDISFLLVNEDIKNFTSINDKVIPMLRINFNHAIFSN